MNKSLISVHAIIIKVFVLICLFLMTRIEIYFSVGTCI